MKQPPPIKQPHNGPFDMGKIPPQAVDIEESILGTLISYKEGIVEVANLIKPESFYKEAHQKIYQAMMDMFYDNRPIELLSLVMELKKNEVLEEVGGAYHISELQNKATTPHILEHHAAIIQQQYIKREIIHTSSLNIQKAFEDNSDPFELLGTAQQGLYDLSNNSFRKDVTTAQELVNRTIKEIEAISANPDMLKGTPSGFSDLDRETSGWQKSDLIIVAARPGMGKTAFALSLARNAAKHKHPTAFFSLEMSDRQLMTRLISAESSIDSKSLRTGDLRDDQWIDINKSSQVIADDPLYIDDSPSLSIYELQAKARRLHAKHGLKLIVIDYIQLMKGDARKGNREQEIGSISRALKSLAKELDIPIVALAQLSRSVETRGGNKKPMLSDLRESGSLEQDADIVIFLYRPEYYGILEDDNGTPTKGMAEVIIAKHRNGSLTSVNLVFEGRYTRFKTDLLRITEDTPAPINNPAFDFDNEMPDDHNPF